MANEDKFKADNPRNEDDKLIAELIHDLTQVTCAFIKLKFKNEITIREFHILRDATMGYAGDWARNLSLLLDDKKDIPDFIYSCRSLFNDYMDDCERKMKEEK